MTHSGHDPAEAYWGSLTCKMLRLALLSILATVAFSQEPCGTYVRVLLAGG